MKYFLLFLFSATLMGLSAQTAGLDNISRALGAGDVAALSSHFDTEVELSLLDKEDVFPKDKAVAQLKTFFGTYPPRNFNQMYQGTSQGSDAEYCIGNLATGNGVFRVYIYLRKAAGKLIIQEMRFDRE